MAGSASLLAMPFLRNGFLQLFSFVFEPLLTMQEILSKSIWLKPNSFAKSLALEVKILGKNITHNEN